MRRLSSHEEVGNAVFFMASPAASYTTGTSLDVTGDEVDEIMPMSPDL